MRGTKLFLLIALIIVCLVLLLYTVFYFLWITPNTGNPLDNSDKVQTLTAIIALIIGTAATVGSAVATLKVASLGLEISKSQEKRDKRVFIEEKVSNAISIYSEIIVAIGDVYTSGLSVDVKISQYGEKEFEELLKGDISIDLEMALTYFANNLDKLSKAIKTLAKDDFSNYCFQNNASELSGKLKKIKKKLVDLGIPDYRVQIKITNLSDIGFFIDNASEKIRNGDSQLITSTRYNTYYAVNEIFNLPYDNASVRSFFFTGNLIFTYSDTIEQLDKIFLVSYGSAILHDLVISIPSNEKIKESLLNRYSGLIQKEDLKLIEYDPDNILLSGLKKAIKDTENIGELYLLIGNMKKKP